MVRQSYTALLERNRVWVGSFATEPYEAAWAGEAIFFLRALETGRTPAGLVARIQISPDGNHWCDEGSRLPLPATPDQVTFARVGHFGGWLRLAGELPPGAEMRVLVYLVLKE